MSVAGTRVAIFLPSLRGGGAEHVMTLLANGFAARGLSVDLVLAEAAGPYLDDVARGVRVIDLKARRVVASLPPLVSYLRRERPAAMLSALSHTNVVAITARQLARVPTRLVVSERGVPMPDFIRSWKGRAIYKAMDLLYPRADHVISVSRYVSSALSRAITISDDKLSVIYNPLPRPSADALAAHRPEHPFLSPAFTTIISVGRLDTVKAHDTLLTAISLSERRAQIRVLLLGEGPLKGSLQQLARSLEIDDLVDFVGFQRHPLAWMAAADLFVLSSVSDAMPNAMLQAMACGLPIVSTDCGGPAEILEQGRWGRLVPVNDPPALARAIDLAIADPAPPDVRTRSRFFDADRITDAYLQALRVTP